jgi:hypothetical protein
MAQKELDPGAAEVQAGMTTTCALIGVISRQQHQELYDYFI